MTDIIVKIIEDDPSQYADGIESQEQILKDCGMSLPEIKASAANRLIGEVVQSRRRPLLGPSPG